MTLLSPISYSSKFSSVLHTFFKTLSTGSRFTLLFVQNFPTSTQPYFLTIGARSTSFPSLSYSFKPAHWFMISSIGLVLWGRLSCLNDFYRWNGEKNICPSGKPKFHLKVFAENLERKRLCSYGGASTVRSASRWVWA